LKYNRVPLQPVLKDLLFKAYELGIQVKFIPISIADYEIWVKNATQAALYYNILGETLTAMQLSAVAIILTKI
jgi:phosphoserine phosphatase